MISLIAFAIQSAYAAETHQPGSSANILVPPSTVRSWFKYGKANSTNYLKWVGPHRGVNPAPLLASAYGPLVRQEIYGYTPQQLRAAYNLAPNLGTGAIAIVDAYDLPNALSDFNKFSSEFGLPQETSQSSTDSTNRVFQVVYAQGSKPASATLTGWNTEEDLDIEWAHAMAPNAKIYLVEATDSFSTHLYPADQVAAALPNVHEVSNSWGNFEYAGETANDSYWLYPGVTFYFSAGDDGGEIDYPTHSVNVVSVGGTQLIMDGLELQQETVWGDNALEPGYGTGGGPSAYETRPTFQSSIQRIVGNWRGAPDISAAADPEYGGAVFSTADGGWEYVGGTSWACPMTAGMVNAGRYYAANSQVENSLLYSFLGTNHIRDITVGGVDFDNTYNATVGWDFCTGVGVPQNIGLPPTIRSAGPDQISQITGTYVSGNLASLSAIDGNDYVETGDLFKGLGATADIRAHFTIPDATPATCVGATITVTAKANYPNIVNEIFVYNTKTKTYDLYGTPLLTTATSTFTVTLSATEAPNYVDTSGNVVVLTRALLPQSQFVGANSKFTYSVDQMEASFSFLPPISGTGGQGGGGG